MICQKGKNYGYYFTGQYPLCCGPLKVSDSFCSCQAPPDYLPFRCPHTSFDQYIKSFCNIFSCFPEPHFSWIQHTGDKAGMISHYMIPEVKFFTESSSWQSPVLQGC